MSRIYACVISVGMIAAVMQPVIQNWKQVPEDSFPLSYYPMFTGAHKEHQTETYIIGLDARGNRLPVNYRYAGRGGANQVRKQLKKVRRQPERAQKLLRSVAVQISRQGDPELSGLEEIRLVRGTYHLEDYFLHGIKEPVKEKILASFRVGSGHSTDPEK